MRLRRLAFGMALTLASAAMAAPAALAEGGVITHHAGILGSADLVPAVHGWTDPVTKIEITRVG